MSKLPEYRQYSGPSSTCFTVGNLQVFFSYSTPVAFQHNDRLVVRENDWSRTTGGHMNTIDGGSKEAKARRISGPEFKKALRAATKGGEA